MPRGRPKNPVIPQWESKVVSIKEVDKISVMEPEKVVSALASPTKLTYSCGCRVVPVNAERNKKKCIKHQVE
jgi:hypothetical protein